MQLKENMSPLNSRPGTSHGDLAIIEQQLHILKQQNSLGTSTGEAAHLHTGHDSMYVWRFSGDEKKKPLPSD